MRCGYCGWRGCLHGCCGRIGPGAEGSWQGAPGARAWGRRDSGRRSRPLASEEYSAVHVGATVSALSATASGNYPPCPPTLARTVARRARVSAYWHVCLPNTCISASRSCNTNSVPTHVRHPAHVPTDGSHAPVALMIAHGRLASQAKMSRAGGGGGAALP